MHLVVLAAFYTGDNFVTRSVHPAETGSILEGKNVQEKLSF